MFLEWLDVRELSKEWEMIHSLPKATTSLVPMQPFTPHMWLNIGMNDVTKQVLITCYTVLYVLSQ